MDTDNTISRLVPICLLKVLHPCPPCLSVVTIWLISKTNYLNSRPVISSPNRRRGKILRRGIPSCPMPHPLRHRRCDGTVAARRHRRDAQGVDEMAARRDVQRHGRQATNGCVPPSAKIFSRPGIEIADDEICQRRLEVYCGAILDSPRWENKSPSVTRFIPFYVTRMSWRSHGRGERSGRLHEARLSAMQTVRMVSFPIRRRSTWT